MTDHTNSQHVILYMNPSNNRIGHITDGDADNDQIAVFQSLADAEDCRAKHPLARAGWPFQLVPIVMRG